MRIANAVSPTMIGMIAASPSSGSKPASRSRSRKVASSRAGASTSSGSPEHADGGQRAAGDRRRHRVREELRPRALREQVADLWLEATKPPAAPPSALPERARDHVDLAEDAEVLGHAASRLAHDAGAVRVVDEHDRVVLAGELDDLRQPGEIALHAEHAVA